ANSGENQIVDPGGDTSLDGQPVAEGWIVAPHDSPLTGPNQIKQADVERIVANARTEALRTRAAIRDSGGSKTRMVIPVADTAGKIPGRYCSDSATGLSDSVMSGEGRGP